MIKYRLSEVAKELNISNKEAVDVLKERLGAVKKPATVLTEEELNIIFEHFTQKNSVAGFDEYFATASDKSGQNETVQEDAAPQAEASEPVKEEKKDNKPAKQEARPAAKPDNFQKGAADKQKQQKPERVRTRLPSPRRTCLSRSRTQSLPSQTALRVPTAITATAQGTALSTPALQMLI